jgi:hypothetical protein
VFIDTSHGHFQRDEFVDPHLIEMAKDETDQPVLCALEPVFKV